MTVVTLPHTFQDGPGHTASGVEVMEQLNAILAAINGALDASNLATSAKPATLLGQYRTVAEVRGVFSGSQTSSAYYPSTLGTFARDSTTASPGIALVPVATTDYSVAGLTTQFRLQGCLAVYGTAPGVNFTYGLYTINTLSGAAINNTSAASLNAVIAGTTVTRATPSANTVSIDSTPDFSIGSSGNYVPGVSISGTTAANTFVSVTLRLQVRHV